MKMKLHPVCLMIFNTDCKTVLVLCRDFAKTANAIEKKAQESKHLDGILFDSDSDSRPRGAPDGIEAPPRSNFENSHE